MQKRIGPHFFSMDKDRMENSWTLPPIRKQSVSGTEHIHFPAVYKGMAEGYELYAETTLNETEENRKKGLQQLKDLVKRENLVCPDDNHLVMVLRCCKYNIKKSEDKLRRFLRTRQTIARELSKMKMEDIEKAIDDLTFIILPYRDKYGRNVCYSKPTFNLENYGWETSAYVSLATAYYSLQFPMTQVYGVSYIADNSKPSFSVYYTIMRMFKKAIPLIIDLPLRIQRIDVTNENIFAGWAFNLLRPVLPLKISKRMNFHGSNFKELHNHYNAELVPECVGGTLVSPNKHYKQDLLNFIKELRAEIL